MVSSSACEVTLRLSREGRLLIKLIPFAEPTQTLSVKPAIASLVTVRLPARIKSRRHVIALVLFKM